MARIPQLGIVQIVRGGPSQQIDLLNQLLLSIRMFEEQFHYFVGQDLMLITLCIQHKSRRLQKYSNNMFDGNAIQDFTGQNSISEWPNRLFIVATEFER